MLKHSLYRCLQYDPSILTEPPPPSTADPLEKFASQEGDSTSADRLYRYGMVRSVSAVLSDLYLRWARRPFSAATLWEVENTESSSVRSELRRQTPFSVALLRVMPWSVNFYERMKLFREVVDTERVSVQGADDNAGGRPRSKGLVVRIRRSHILHDGMAALDRVGNAIKDRVVVRYLNEFGEEEAGAQKS